MEKRQMLDRTDICMEEESPCCHMNEPPALVNPRVDECMRVGGTHRRQQHDQQIHDRDGFAVSADVYDVHIRLSNSPRTITKKRDPGHGCEHATRFISRMRNPPSRYIVSNKTHFVPSTVKGVVNHLPLVELQFTYQRARGSASVE